MVLSVGRVNLTMIVMIRRIGRCNYEFGVRVRTMNVRGNMWRGTCWALNRLLLIR